jgi:hypothetical protein
MFAATSRRIWCASGIELDLGPRLSLVHSSLSNGHADAAASCPFGADFVAKVENRTTLKISRKLIFELLCCWVAFQRHYGGPRSVLDKTIWSLTSPRVKCISGSRNFRSLSQKDFCNNICQHQTAHGSRLENLMDFGSPIFNLAATFANWDPNFVELLRVQSVGAIISRRD